MSAVKTYVLKRAISPGKRYSRRKQLFDLYARNLKLGFPEAPECFVCPTCRFCFPKESLDCSPPLVDLSHVTPRALKPRILTLECRECNSRFGHDSDAHVVAEERLSRLQKGEQSIPATLEFDGGRFAVNWSKKGTNHDLKMVAGTSPPDAWEKLGVVLKNRGDFHLTFGSHKPQARNASLLHSAFLALFHTFGYGYVLSSEVSVIREVLLGQRKVDEFAKCFWNLSNFGCEADLTQPLVGILQSPQELCCFIVLLPDPFTEPTRRVIALPGFGQAGTAAYERIVRGAHIGTRIAATVTPLDGEIRSHAFTEKRFVHRFWNEAVRAG